MLKFLCRCEEPRSGDDGVPADIVPEGEGPRRRYPQGEGGLMKVEGQVVFSLAGGIPVVVARDDISF
ncbi:MAG: hypothetical protein IMZ50_13190 [Candidatus Atribacteria bacterium]|nr:hypothetical protein [Candidatus Atribacteria bacterium]